MLGTLYDKWDKCESVDIKEGDKFIIIRGKRLEVKLEEENKLRLSLVEMVDNKDEQHRKAVSCLMNSLEQHRKELVVIKQELKEIYKKLDIEEFEEGAEEALEGQARDKRALQRSHVKEIKKLEAQTTVRVNYRLVKTGLTAVLTPGLTLHPKFLSEPVCWCPYNMPESKLLDETTTMVEEMPLTFTSAQQTTAKGLGLKVCFTDRESKFVITAKDIDGQPRDVGGDQFVVESKEAEIKYSVIDKRNGMYEVNYSGVNAKFVKQFSLSVTLLGRPIGGSPFSVNPRTLLVEFSSAGHYNRDWLDAAVANMSNISNARLWVSLHDESGAEVYMSTGVTNGKWTQKHITSPGNQWYDENHGNAIQLENGDRVMIIGKESKGAPSSFYNPYNIIVNAGWDNSNLSSWKHPRRMIIYRQDVIYFSSSGFYQSDIWPAKFNGIFRIYCMPL